MMRRCSLINLAYPLYHPACSFIFLLTRNEPSLWAARFSHRGKGVSTITTSLLDFDLALLDFDLGPPARQAGRLYKRGHSLRRGDFLYLFEYRFVRWPILRVFADVEEAYSPRLV